MRYLKATIFSEYITNKATNINSSPRLHYAMLKWQMANPLALHMFFNDDILELLLDKFNRTQLIMLILMMQLPILCTKVLMILLFNTTKTKIKQQMLTIQTNMSEVGL